MSLSIGPGISIGGGINFRSEGAAPSAPSTVEYLVVAGGGGGAGVDGGGGGAGGLLTATGYSITAGSPITVTVGAGGSGSVYSAYASQGQDSIFGTITTKGGGYGMWSGQTGGNGGSGGGGCDGGTGAKGVYPGSTYLSQTRQGYDGGNSTSGNLVTSSGGGGGGAGA